MPGPRTFATTVGDALRAVRYARVLSQRGLATELGVGKSTLARWENGAVGGSVLLLQEVLERVGFELVLVDRRAPSATEPPSPPHGGDPELADIFACWRDRVDQELVRDAAGRRPPAHRHVYPLLVPHSWWVARHPGTPWVLRPVWSFSWSITWRHVVRRLGRYPPPVGLPPRGGAPMQGYPP